jgi:hypothetical protein
MSTLKRRGARGKTRIRRRKPAPQLSTTATDSAPPSNHDVLLVTAQAMAVELGQPVARVFDWLKLGRISCAKKIGDTWIAPRNALRREFGLDTV